MKDSQPVSQLPTAVSGLYRLNEADSSVARTGQPYLRLELENAYGAVRGFGWAGRYSGPWHLENVDAVGVHGHLRHHNGKQVIDVGRLCAASPSSEELLHILPGSRCPCPATLREFLRLAANLESAILRGFLGQVLGGREIGTRFLSVPASLKHHHNYPGGLLVHSVQCGQMIGALPGIPTRQRDIAIVAALLHDIGKVWVFDQQKRRTLLGELLHHDALTLEICATALADLDQIWPDAALALRHVWAWRTGRHGSWSPDLNLAHALQYVDRVSAGYRPGTGAVRNFRTRFAKTAPTQNPAPTTGRESSKIYTLPKTRP